ncbi:MAG TPA: SLBB domain-containing protein [Longimicrobium sp.]|nr:SLBB domain-containing protein [Longimicrobium sp.]
MKRLACLAVLFLASACARGPALTPAPETGEAALRPGDAVKLTVWRQPELSGELTVADDGTLSHPLLRAARVGDVPLPRARAAVGEVLRGYAADPQFVMEPLLRVSVAGEVRQPRLYPLSPQTTVRQAISTAGGATERAVLSRVRLLRGDRLYVLDLTTEGAGGDVPVRSGDEIVLARRSDVLREVVQPLASLTGAVAALLTLYRTTRGS